MKVEQSATTRQTTQAGQDDNLSLNTGTGFKFNRFTDQASPATSASLNQDINLRSHAPAKFLTTTYSKVYTFNVPAGTKVEFSYERSEGNTRIKGHNFSMSENARSLYDRDNAYIKRETINGVDHYTVGTYTKFNGTFGVHASGKTYNLNPLSDPVSEVKPKILQHHESDQKQENTSHQEQVKEKSQEIKNEGRKEAVETEKPAEKPAEKPVENQAEQKTEDKHAEEVNKEEVKKEEVAKPVSDKTVKPQEAPKSEVPQEKAKEEKADAEKEKYQNRLKEIQAGREDFEKKQEEFRKDKIAVMEARLRGAEANLAQSEREIKNTGFWTTISGGKAALETARDADQKMVDELRNKVEHLKKSEKYIQRQLEEAKKAEKLAAQYAKDGLNERASEMLKDADLKLRIGNAWMNTDVKVNTSGAQAFYRLAGERMSKSEDFLATTEKTLRTVRNGTVVVGATLATGGAAGLGAVGAVGVGTATGTGIGVLANSVEAAGHVAYGNKTASQAISDAAVQSAKDLGHSAVASVSMVAGGQAAGAASKFIPSQVSGLAAHSLTGGIAGGTTLGSAAAVNLTAERWQAEQEFSKLYAGSDLSPLQREEAYNQFLSERGLTLGQIGGQIISQAETGIVTGSIGGATSAQIANGVPSATGQLAGYSTAIAGSAASHIAVNGEINIEDIPQILTDGTIGYLAGNVNSGKGTGPNRTRRARNPEPEFDEAVRFRNKPETEQSANRGAKKATDAEMPNQDSGPKTQKTENTASQDNHKSQSARTESSANTEQNPGSGTKNDQTSESFKPKTEASSGPEVNTKPKGHPVFEHVDRVRTRQDALRALGLEPNGNYTQAEITQAYRKNSRLYHPDLNPEIGSQPFKIIQKAFDILQRS